MRICGIQKVSLLDYPNKIACTIFTQSCNFKCPFCQNAKLVIPAIFDPIIEENNIIDFLKSRIGKLDGVVISGGEPTLQNDLIDFISKVKEMGYLVKLDTNGSNLPILKELVEKKLIDYVAVDIKNSLEKYPSTCGLLQMNLDNIKQTINYLLQDHIDYEFRTTLVKEFHCLEDVNGIATLIKGCKRHYLQNFQDSEFVIRKGLHGFTDNELIQFKQKFINLGINTYIRGE